MHLHIERARRKVVVAGLVGNIMEWYDFGIYGFFARTIGKLYFPADSATDQLLATFAVFAVGFIMRPFGAIIFGHVGDRVGRGPALLWSVVAMAIPTLGIGLLPTYADIGPLAPALIILFRIVQGLAVGGEYTSSAVFLAETAVEGRRGFACAWAPVGAVAGILLGSAVGSFVMNSLSLDQVVAWGWRIPFLFGVVVGGIGFLLRRRMEIDKPAAHKGFPLAGAIRGHRLELLQVLGLSVVNAICFYISFVYIVSWLGRFAGLKAAVALEINSVNMAVMLVVIMISAWVSDRIGRRPILLAASVGLAVFSWPLMALMQMGTVWSAFAGQFGLALLVGTYGGVIPATICEMFPKSMRCSAVSTGYNLTVGITGGTAPMIATWLIGHTGYGLAPAIYSAAGAALSAVAAWSLKERSRHRLEDQAAPMLAKSAA
jgi:MHS family proline/betaine transporter-like MFS transporter